MARGPRLARWLAWLALAIAMPAAAEEARPSPRAGAARADPARARSARRESTPERLGTREAPRARFVETLRDPAQLRSSRAPESEAFARRGVNLRGTFDPVVTSATDREATIRSKGRSVTLQGRRYTEFPNSTALTTTDPTTGKSREFLITRGVRAGYDNVVNLGDGSQAPRGYVSDVLLFENVGSRSRFRGRLLSSRPEASFLFEDPRISTLYAGGERRVFLSGTDFSPHVAGSGDKDVMNRYVELALDGRGVPLAVKVDRKTGKPAFHDLSPPPAVAADGKPVFTDAKNGTIAENEQGQIVVRTRMRPDFGDPAVRALAGDRRWSYGEQVFVFKDLGALEAYDWKHGLTDLLAPETATSAGDRVRPVATKILLTDKGFHEAIDDPRVEPDRKGFGPGTIPVRVRRDGNDLYVSEGHGAPETLVGTIPLHARAGFPVAPGEVKHVTFDHEIRWFTDRRGDHTFTKRHYSMAVKLFDDSLTKIDAYYADVVQPTRQYERGKRSGILDLQHVYPMGRTIGTSKGKVSLRVFAGASDAHTALYEFDVMKLLGEMATDSPRRATGQVYTP